MVLMSDAHAAETSPDTAVKELLHFTDDILLPGMAVKEAVLAFDRAEAEALAVVDSYRDRRVVGAVDRGLCAAPIRSGAGTAAPRHGRRRIAVAWLYTDKA